MFKWIKDVIREYKKGRIKRRFEQFSKFKGPTRVEEFKKASETLKSIELFYYRGDSLDLLIKSLDCIKVDEGWHIDINYLFPHKKARYPILYCYKDKKPDDWESIEKKYTHDNVDGWLFRMRINPYNIYKHISVTPTEMGAWQVYLLELYPFIKNGIDKDNNDWETTLLVSSYQDIIPERHRENITWENIDTRPYVWMKGSKAYVSGCRWVRNSGLFRDIYTIIFDGNRVKDIFVDGEILHDIHVTGTY